MRRGTQLEGIVRSLIACPYRVSGNDIITVGIQMRCVFFAGIFNGLRDYGIIVGGWWFGDIVGFVLFVSPLVSISGDGCIYSSTRLLPLQCVRLWRFPMSIIWLILSGNLIVELSLCYVVLLFFSGICFLRLSFDKRVIIFLEDSCVCNRTVGVALTLGACLRVACVGSVEHHCDATDYVGPYGVSWGCDVIIEC